MEAVSSCTATFFFLHSHNFFNPKTDLHLLFEIEIWELLQIYQSGSESCCFPDEEVFWKQSLHKLLISGLLNPKA